MNKKYSKACFSTLLIAIAETRSWQPYRMALVGLPDDALRAVLQRLGPQELCKCKSVCRKLALMACEVILPLSDHV